MELHLDRERLKLNLRVLWGRQPAKDLGIVSGGCMVLYIYIYIYVAKLGLDIGEYLYTVELDAERIYLKLVS